MSRRKRVALGAGAGIGVWGVGRMLLQRRAKANAAAEAATAPVPDANSSPSLAKGAGKPVRQYLDDTVVPVLRKGLRELVKQRPEDPFEFLAEFIKSNKPKTSD